MTRNEEEGKEKYNIRPGPVKTPLIRDQAKRVSIPLGKEKRDIPPDATPLIIEKEVTKEKASL